jgi:hypothetical protein
MSLQAGQYKIRRITFEGKKLPVLCQNEGGPCPLLAILSEFVQADQAVE